MFGISMQELIVIFIIVLLVFGPKRLPDIGKALGRGLREFRKAANEIKEGIEQEEYRQQEKATNGEAKLERSHISKKIDC